MLKFIVEKKLYKYVYWIRPPQNKDQSWAVLKALMKLSVPKNAQFLN
jgi:hypothetical protein